MLYKNVYQWKWNFNILCMYIVVITWNCSAADMNLSVNLMILEVLVEDHDEHYTSLSW